MIRTRRFSLPALLGLFLGVPTLVGAQADRLNSPSRVTNPRLEGTQQPQRSGLPEPLESRGEAPLGLPPIGGQLSPVEAARMERDLISLGRSVSDPGERGFTLCRIAEITILGVRDSREPGDLDKLDEAQRILIEAWQALRLVNDRLVHDNREVALVDTLLLLGAVYKDLGLVSDVIPLLENTLNVPPQTKQSREAALQRSLRTFTLAAQAATEIRNPNFRSETLYRVAEQHAEAANNIATAQVEMSRPPSATETTSPLNQEEEADRAFQQAANHARLIQRQVWMDQALLAVVLQAASANRFATAIGVASTIPEPQVRAEGLIRTAEYQIANGQPSDEITRTYSEAARAVASIPREDPRAVLANLLVQSLSEAGRFPDARACVALLNDPVQREAALVSIAEEMGRRGLDQLARDWILREAPPNLQSRLLRSVSTGVIESIKQYRTSTLPTLGIGSGLVQP
jgi:hypothetical protein